MTKVYKKYYKQYKIWDYFFQNLKINYKNILIMIMNYSKKSIIYLSLVEVIVKMSPRVKVEMSHKKYDKIIKFFFWIKVK